LICSNCSKLQTQFDPHYVDEYGNPKYYKPLTKVNNNKIIFCSPRCATEYNDKLRKENADRK